MKQMIVVTNDRKRYEKAFDSRYFYITWSTLDVEDLLSKRSSSNLILVCMDHEDEIALKKIGLYLRDICIDDEKIVYLYGNKEDVDTMSALVPSMFIKKKMYAFTHFSMLVEKLVDSEVRKENSKPYCVILDDDVEYVEKLRVQLDSFFRVAVCRFDPAEINDLVLIADVVLVSVDGRLKLSEFMGLFHMLLAKKKVPRFRFYYLTRSDQERNAMNAGIEKSSISFSKQMDVEHVAKYLINQYSNMG